MADPIVYRDFEFYFTNGAGPLCVTVQHGLDTVDQTETSYHITIHHQRGTHEERSTSMTIYTDKLNAIQVTTRTEYPQGSYPRTESTPQMTDRAPVSHLSATDPAQSAAFWNSVKIVTPTP